MRFEKIKKAIVDLYPQVDVSLERGCITLRGELDNWDDIYKAGTLAVDRNSLGVINDIKLKGFKDKISAPKVKDTLLQGGRPDVLIIGGGIVGSAVARELSKLKLNTWLVEKAGDVAMHASSRNDGCVHVGIDLHRGQQKLKYCLSGNRLYGDLCRDLSVDLANYAQILIFAKHWENILLAPIMKLQGKRLGVWGLKHLSKKGLSEVEPSPPKWAKGAMYMSSASVVSPYKMTIALAENAAQNGVKFFFDTIVEGMELERDEIVAVKTNRGIIHPKLVINCAGVMSDVVAEMAGDRTFTIHPRKGTNLILDKKKNYYSIASIAKSPFSKPPKDFRETALGKLSHTKGGGIVRTIDQNILVGPNAVEQPYREDYTTTSEEVDNIIKKHSLVQKELSKADVITYFAGTRAATYEEDFVVRKGIFTKNIIQAAGIQSPGITAAPSIACDIREWTAEYLGAEENEKFDPVRKGIPHMATLDTQERNEYIKQNPSYGEIYCRCEEVSKGEIIDAINNPLGVCSLDGIKRRVRPGMGRCQGGFCSPLVLRTIAEVKGIAPEQVQKSDKGSELLMGNTKTPNMTSDVKTKNSNERKKSEKTPTKEVTRNE